jgi:hypothetical protein
MFIFENVWIWNNRKEKRKIEKGSKNRARKQSKPETITKKQKTGKAWWSMVPPYLFRRPRCHMYILETCIVGFLPYIAGCCDVVVTRRRTEIWIFGFCHYVKGCCDGAVMRPHAGIGIFGLLLHAEGYCSGTVTCFAAGFLPCVAVYFLLIRDLGVRLDAYIHMDLQMLVVW